MKIGIIGYGFVGKAVASAYDDVLINDPLYENSVSVEQMAQQCDAIFVCVPTPQSESGKCDSSILEQTIQTLSNYNGVIVCKSTATPNVYSKLEQDNPNLKLAHVPEFLIAANAVHDYLYPTKVVVGCKQAIREQVVQVIMSPKIMYSWHDVDFCSIAEASMFKYLANTMLAMKVIMNNEYYDLCNSMGINYNTVANIASSDPRLGTSHWQVPGPDGSRGFGGACFPKDTNALVELAKSYDVQLSVLTSALEKNKKYRD